MSKGKCLFTQIDHSLQVEHDCNKPLVIQNTKGTMGQIGVEKFLFPDSQNNGVFTTEITCFKEGVWESFWGCHITCLNILEALCSILVLHNVPTSALKPCKWIFSPARPCWALPSADKYKTYWTVSPAEKKLVSSLRDHLKYNTGNFAINKTCIRCIVHQFPVHETTLIINHV